MRRCRKKRQHRTKNNPSDAMPKCGNTGDIVDQMSGNQPRVLVTGAAGYIGSHTCIELLGNGFEVIGVDNFDNSEPVVLDRIAELAGRAIDFVELDIRDTDKLRAVVAEYQPTAVIHFAGLKAVGESVEKPHRYWSVNVGGTLSLLDAIDGSAVERFIFSSSCTVYGDPANVPVTEETKVAPISPYGRTKLAAEQAIIDCLSTRDCGGLLLRYFNPVGAHPSGRIGEDPVGIPNNLMPFAMQVAVGRRAALSIFGNDYDTPDGTCIRDYIHVVDLALGHVAALSTATTAGECDVVNLGTGTGSSVLEVVQAAGDAVGTPIAFEIVDRRAGDAAVVYSDTSKAREVLGWTATRDIGDMCRDHWLWQSQNPDGYN